MEPSIPRTTRRQLQHRVNVPATNPESYWQTATYLLVIDHLIQEMNDRLLSQEDCFLGQYRLPTKLQGLSNDVQDKMHYASYKNDQTDKREYNNETLGWKTKLLHSTGKRPATLADTLDRINPTLYRNVTAILTMLASTTTPQRSFSRMRRVKTNLRATMKTEQLSVLALMHAYKDITIDGEAVAREFCGKKNRMLNFGFP